ncbi:MBL fold metallo-hydrolase [Deminuibacter soli]|nr:MBL fold metallo-hydrolase [Deminuibacter soli]
MQVTITQIDTACMLISVNGFHIVTDPAFDAAGSHYPGGRAGMLVKTGSPALLPAQLGAVDLVLISHDQHKDNLDNAGREFIKTVPLVISTKEAQQRLEDTHVHGLDEWESVAIPNNKVPGLTITATPCQHAPNKELDKGSGHVIGFIVTWLGQQNGALYISGDTVLFEGIQEIANRFTIDTAILHIGHAGFPELTGDMNFTFTGAEAIEAAHILKARKLVPTHMEGWEHFLETPETTYSLINGSDIKEKLVRLKRGEGVTIDI